jgi:hypothetical protein
LVAVPVIVSRIRGAAIGSKLHSITAARSILLERVPSRAGRETGTCSDVSDVSDVSDESVAWGVGGEGGEGGVTGEGGSCS